MEKTHSYIEKKIAGKKKGELIFPTEFRGNGTESAIKKALSRLAVKGTIKRLAHGIYYVPEIDPLLGELRPSADEVIRMLAGKEKIRVRPAGAYALHRLGLTTQVPTKLVFITDGHARHFKLGKLDITFKATTPKKLATKGKVSSLLIQALEEIGPGKIDSDTEARILVLLAKEDPEILKNDLSLAPSRVNDYVVRLLKKEENDRLAKTNG